MKNSLFAYEDYYRHTKEINILIHLSFRRRTGQQEQSILKNNINILPSDTSRLPLGGLKNQHVTTFPRMHAVAYGLHALCTSGLSIRIQSSRN